MRVRLLMVIGGIAVGTWGCALVRPSTANGPRRELRFEPVTVTGDLELEKLNDEELYAGGAAAYAAGDWAKAARYFGRLADYFPQSQHRREALFKAGEAYEKIEHWEEAYMRFSELSDPYKGLASSLDAAFRVAETQYHLGRFDDAAKLLAVIAARTDIEPGQRLQAQVQQGICEVETGELDKGEATLRKALAMSEELKEKDEVDPYYPAQAQFFLGEIYRLHYESVQLDPEKGVDQLAKDLEYKAELLLSAQGHYLRAIRMGNGDWATAAGAQIGGLYENLYDHMSNSPAPKELNAEEAEVYKQEVRKKIRILLTKAISIYERTLEAAERIGASNPFVEKTKQSLQKMRDLLVAAAEHDDQEGQPSTPVKTAPSAPPSHPPLRNPEAKEPRI